MRDRQRKKTHRCRICGAYGATHIHHIFGGARRSISEKNNFVIELCPGCHQKAHSDSDFGDALKHDCQLEFLESHSQEDWMELMGKSWIEIGERNALYGVTAHEPGTPYNADDFDDYISEQGR